MKIKKLDMEKIKRVVTLYQPYATLLAYAIKKNETRPGPTSHTFEKGEYLIHAARKWTKEQRDLCFTEPFKSELLKLGIKFDRKVNRDTLFPFLPLVQIIGSFEVKECVEVSNTIEDYGNIAVAYAKINTNYTFRYPELYYGDYNKGRSIWIGQNHKVLKYPIPYKGGQGYYQKFKGDISQLKF